MNVQHLIFFKNSQRMRSVLGEEEAQKLIDLIDKLVANDVFIEIEYQKPQPEPVSQDLHP